MSETITISKTLNFRECGKDEYWLQDQVFNNPSILGLGELDVVSKEKRQSSGGRLDLLLKNPEDDSMYEVEIMLGETDESHIVRAIEYWDLERRRWPKRQHTAVLVAESITRRFFNVIQLLSLSIPVIAIQANIIDADGKQILHFTTVLDIYEEQEESNAESGDTFDEQWWRANAAWNVINTEVFQKLVTPALGKSELGFTKNYVSVVCNGYIYFSFRKRGEGKSSLKFYVSNANFNSATEALVGKNFPYDAKPNKSEGQNLKMLVDQKLIQANPDLFLKIADLVKQSWQT